MVGRMGGGGGGVGERFDKKETRKGKNNIMGKCDRQDFPP